MEGTTEARVRRHNKAPPPGQTLRSDTSLPTEREKTRCMESEENPVANKENEASATSALPG